MQVEIEDTRIINFFKKHKDLGVEETILASVEIIERLEDLMNPTMDTKIMTILDGISSLKKEQKVLVETVDRLGVDTKTDFALKMGELKRSYTEELKMLITCNISDKIEPTLKEQNKLLFDKVQQLLNIIIPNKMDEILDEFKNIVSTDSKDMLSNTVDRETLAKYLNEFNKVITKTIDKTERAFSNEISKSEGRLEHKIEKIASNTVVGNETTNNLCKSVGSFLQKFENSNIKGKMSENLIESIIEELFPTGEIETVSQTKETGDILLHRQDKPKILIENKSWGRVIPQKEVVKFIRDIDTQKCCGIFLSQNTGISTKGNYEINIHDGNILVYVHDVHNDPYKIKIAVDIIDNLKDRFDQLTEECGDTLNSISNEQMEYLNVEYQTIIASREKLIKMCKEFNRNVLKQIDDIKFPTLESILSPKFTMSSSKFVCEFCNFVGKNQQSKSAHMRGCLAKKQFESGNAVTSVNTSTE